MTVFPKGPISFGMAEVVLREVTRSLGGEVVARYDLVPTRHKEFVDRIGGLREWLGRRYEPVPGIWATYTVPEDRDEFEFTVGLCPDHGYDLVHAHKKLHSKSESVVSPLTVRTLALGYLAKAGV